MSTASGLIAQARLYAFVDTAYLNGRPLGQVTQELCDGGADMIQLRAKTSTSEEIRAMAEQILPITTGAGVPLVINDHFEIAQNLSAPFCHLGQEDFFEAGYSRVSDLPPPAPPHGQPLIGLSTHAPEQALRAIGAEPAYIAIGPVYATGTKPGARPVTLEYVSWAAREVAIPWFALGGINLENLDEVLAAGARRICVVSAILNRRDVAQACHEFKRRLLSLP